VYLRNKDFYQKHHVQALLGREARSLDVANQIVTLDGDEKLEYDRLLIATGSRPFVPPITGLENTEYHTFTTFEEAKSLKSAAVGRKNAVVLGTGLIGLQCAEALRHLGLDVMVVEMANMILPQALDEASAVIVSREIQDEGIGLRLGNTIERISSENHQPRACTLKSGENVPCDLLVISVGVRSNTDLAHNAGIAVDRGIVVNDRMQTNVENVFAAGDCAQGSELTTGTAMTLPVIPVASTHGMIAGYNMAGQRRTYRGGLSLNALQFGKTQVVSYGFIKDEKDGEVLCVEDADRSVYKKVIIKDKRVIGAVFVRDIDRAGIFRHLIEQRIDVTPFKEHLLTSDFGIAHLPVEERARMFTTPQ